MQSYPQMQSFFMDQLYKQEFTLIPTNAPLDVVQPHLRSYASPPTRTWLLIHFNTPSFHLSFAHFFIALCIRFDIPHPIVAHLSRCQCGHTIDDLGIHLLHYSCGSECIIAWCYISKYHCNYHIKKWSPRTEKGFSPFSSPHLKTIGYCHHKRHFSNHCGRCCYRYDLFRFGVACFDDDSACNNNCRSR
jgi:hypothetical protein